MEGYERGRGYQGVVALDPGFSSRGVGKVSLYLSPSEVGVCRVRKGAGGSEELWLVDPGFGWQGCLKSFVVQGGISPSEVGGGVEG